jgi:hypothetical protein
MFAHPDVARVRKMPIMMLFAITPSSPLAVRGNDGDFGTILTANAKHFGLQFPQIIII